MDGCVAQKAFRADGREVGKTQATWPDTGTGHILWASQVLMRHGNFFESNISLLENFWERAI